MAKTYLKLAEYYTFVSWFALPRYLRIPETQERFSEMHGVGHDTLARWKSDPHFVEDVKRAHYKISHEYVGDVINAMYATAMSGDVKAQIAFLKYFSNLPNPDKPTAGELQAQGETLADTLLQRLKDRQARTQAPIHHDVQQHTITGGE